LDPTKFALPNGLSVPPGGHLLLWADSEPLQGIDHLGFHLAAAGEEIGLFDTDLRGNAPIDTVIYGAEVADVAAALCPDGFYLFESTANASPGAPNLGSPDCLIGSHVSLFGTAQGGEIRITIEGTLVVLITLAGQSAEDVAIALAAAITSDPTLSSAGVSASALGSQVAINGTVDSLVIDDPGLGPTPTPTATPPICSPEGASCGNNGDCCSNLCSGPGGNKVCQPEATPTPPICSPAGASCGNNGDCCSNLCSGPGGDKVCQPGATPSVTPTASPTPTPTPEPGVMLQLVSGAVGLAWLNKRRNRGPCWAQARNGPREEGPETMSASASSFDLIG
jgi:hypothetical protein